MPAYPALHAHAKLVTCSWCLLLLGLASQPCGASFWGERRSLVQAQMSVDPKTVIPGRFANKMVSEGRFIGSDDMGVNYCRLFVNGSAFGKELDFHGEFMLHIFFRYTVFEGVARVKGTVTVEPMEPVTSTGKVQDVQFDPLIRISALDNSSSFPANSSATFPFMPITVSAAASPLVSTFAVVPSLDHEFYVYSKGANNSCSFKPAMSPNQLDYRGIEIDTHRNPHTQVNESYVVMSPFFNMRLPNNIEKFAVLLGRHIQWHRGLGFTRHLVYLRADDIMTLTAIPAVQHWLSKGFLLLVLWETIPEHAEMPYYDQRMVYSHSILAFTGLDVHLAMLDLDEYVMSMRDELRTFQDMSRACNASHMQTHRQLAGTSGTSAGPQAGLQAPAPQLVHLLVKRYHSMAKGYYRLSPESELWAATPLEAGHPLLRYSVINRMRAPAVKSIVRPEFMHSYSTHGTSHGNYSAISPDPDCVFLLHLKNLFTSRDSRYNSKSGMRRLGFTEDMALEKALQARAARLGNDWIMPPGEAVPG